MNLKKNEIEILKLLLTATDYISSYDIATATGINRRLVRDEIASIKNILKELGYELISKTSKGYMIKNKNSASLQDLQNFIEEAQKQRESLFPTQPWERSNYILKRLIDVDDYMKIDQLADELLVSRSTISNDIKNCRHSMKKYHLSLIQKPNYGIRILGQEINKRKPICDFLFTNLRQSEMFYDYLNSFVMEATSLEHGILEIIKKYDIEMSDFALCDFLLSLSVTLSRILKGKTVQESPDLSSISLRNEFIAAKEIAAFIEEKTDVHLNTHEIHWIGIELICKRSTKGLTFHQNPTIIRLADEILETIAQQTLFSLHHQPFYTTFCLYVENALLRIQYDEKIRNPLFDELKTTYPLGYYMAEMTSSVIEKYTQRKLSMSELAFFAVIFHNAINNQPDAKKKVLLICGLGGGAQDLSSYFILQRFENQIQIVKTLSYYKLPDEDLSAYDFIISTVPIHKTLSIPTLNLSQIITNDDLEQIHTFLHYQYHQDILKTIFLPQLYQDHVIAHHKKDVIKAFYHLLKQQFPQIKESFQSHMNDSQYHQFTLFPNQVALIALNKPLTNNNMLSVLILNKSIMWNKKEIKMIILFSCSDPHHFILNTLMDTLKSLTTCNDIMDIYQHVDYPTFLKTILKHEKNSFNQGVSINF